MVYRLYEFDKRLRNLIQSHLEPIEVAFRTHIAYRLAHQYGALGYLQDANFINAEYHAKFMDELKREIDRRQDELFVAHHLQKYGGQFPIWVAVEVLSFGTLSKLYANLLPEDKGSIAKGYYQAPFIYVVSWLRSLSKSQGTRRKTAACRGSFRCPCLF